MTAGSHSSQLWEWHTKANNNKTHKQTNKKWNDITKGRVGTGRIQNQQHKYLLLQIFRNECLDIVCPNASRLLDTFAHEFHKSHFWGEFKKYDKTKIRELMQNPARKVIETNLSFSSPSASGSKGALLNCGIGIDDIGGGGGAFIVTNAF